MSPPSPELRPKKQRPQTPRMIQRPRLLEQQQGRQQPQLRRYLRRVLPPPPPPQWVRERRQRPPLLLQVLDALLGQQQGRFRRQGGAGAVAGEPRTTGGVAPLLRPEAGRQRIGTAIRGCPCPLQPGGWSPLASVSSTGRGPWLQPPLHPGIGASPSPPSPLSLAASSASSLASASASSSPACCPRHLPQEQKELRGRCSRMQCRRPSSSPPPAPPPLSHFSGSRRQPQFPPRGCGEASIAEMPPT